MNSNAAAELPLFSLVVPTCGRTAEIDRLMRSLVAQKADSIGRDTLDVLVMDQNQDERVASVVARYEGDVAVRRIRCRYKNCSRAKNEGVGLAVGRWILFPDDDCWFDAGFFCRLRDKLQKLPDSTALFVRAYDPRLRVDLISYPRREVLISNNNRERAFLGLQIGQVYPAAVVRNIPFDEEIGPGEARWPGGEETDLALRVLAANHSIVFTPELMVFHDMVDGQVMSINKVRRYAVGFGAVCRKNKLNGHCLLKVVKQVCGAAVFLLVGRWWRAWVAANTAWFRMRGFFDYARDVPRDRR